MESHYDQIIGSLSRKPGRPRKSQLQDKCIREVQVQYNRLKEARFKIRSEQDVAEFLRGIAFDNSREHFFALFLDGAHKVACYSLIALGTANCCPVHPREIFQRAVICGAVSMVVAHNHPSGELNPSEADLQITKQIQAGGDLLGIKLLDHVIFSDHNTFSMREHSNWCS